MRIAITIESDACDDVLRASGDNRDALFLARTLMLAFPDAEILLADTMPAMPARTEWDATAFRVCPLSGCVDAVDLLIVLGGVVSQEQVNRIKRYGGHVVGYKCSPEYAHPLEHEATGSLTGKERFYPRGFDEVWVTPQVSSLNFFFFQSIHRTIARHVPALWDPFLLEAAVQRLPAQGRYMPGRKQKRLSIMELNADGRQEFLYPLMIAEEVFRGDGAELIDFVSVTNTDLFRRHGDLLDVASHFDLVNASKCFFENHHDAAWFLSSRTDILITHQWGNTLNPACLEACWLGYPLVHNTEMIRDLGYYYPGFDAGKGRDELLHAMRLHDVTADEYHVRQRQGVSRFLASNPELVNQYRQLVNGVMQGASVAA